MKLNPEWTTKVMSLTTSTSGQEKRMKSAPTPLFVMSNKVPTKGEFRNPEPSLEFQQQERSVTSPSHLEEIEDIDEDLKIQPEKSTSLMSLSASSGTDGGEGTREELDEVPDTATDVNPISLTVLSSVGDTPGTNTEPHQELGNSTSSICLSRASTLEGTEEEPEVPGSGISLDIAAILDENREGDDEIEKTKPGSCLHSDDTGQPSQGKNPFIYRRIIRISCPKKSLILA